MPLQADFCFIGILRPAYLHARVSWLLLLLASVVLAANPFTQNNWTWDGFLHGGQDFETNLLLILAALCLVLVLVHRMQQNAAIRTFLLWRSLSLPEPAIGRRAQARLPRTNEEASPPERACNLPLLI